MKNNKSSAFRRGVSVLEKLFVGMRKGPSGERVRKLRKMQKRIGVRFTDLALLEQALTHRSYSHVTSQTRNDSNERMEFLGDSVLGLAVSQFLYLQFPDRSEGALSKMKSLLVSRKVLSTIAREIGLGEFLLLSGEESEMGGRERASILADSFEGVIGAIYLDQGYRAANKFIQQFLLGSIHGILGDEDHTNFKSLLQEYVQSKRLSHPMYRVRKEEGPEHEKEFAVEVVVKGDVWGTGRGKSKKDAEQNAARTALENRQGLGIRRPRSETAEAPPAPPRARARRRGRAEPEAGAVKATAKDRGEHGIAASREKLRERREVEAEERRRAERERGERRRPGGREESRRRGERKTERREKPGGEPRRDTRVEVRRRPSREPRPETDAPSTEDRPRTERRRRRRRRPEDAPAQEASPGVAARDEASVEEPRAPSVERRRREVPGASSEPADRESPAVRSEARERAAARKAEPEELLASADPVRAREPEGSDPGASGVASSPEAEPAGFVRRRRKRRERPPSSGSVERSAADEAPSPKGEAVVPEPSERPPAVEAVPAAPERSERAPAAEPVPAAPEPEPDVRDGFRTPPDERAPERAHRSRRPTRPTGDSRRAKRREEPRAEPRTQPDESSKERGGESRPAESPRAEPPRDESRPDESRPERDESRRDERSRPASEPARARAEPEGPGPEEPGESSTAATSGDASPRAPGDGGFTRRKRRQVRGLRRR